MTTFEIPAESFPTGQYSVTLKEPLFKDRMEAFNEYPQGTQCGYTVQELLIAKCLIAINGEKITGGTASHQLIDNIKSMHHKDYQHMLAVFMTLTQLSDEDQALVKSISQQYARSLDPEVSISKESMPSGLHNVRFFLPKVDGKIRCQAMMGDSTEADLGYSFEELFCAYSLLTVDNQGLPSSRNRSKESLINLFAEFPLVDANFTLSVFLSLTAMNRNEADKSIDLGKGLRAQNHDRSLLIARSAQDTASRSKSSQKSKKSPQPVES